MCAHGLCMYMFIGEHCVKAKGQHCMFSSIASPPCFETGTLIDWADRLVS